MLSIRLSRVVAVALATLVVACGDPTRPKATVPNVLLSYSVHTFTGAPAGQGNAISFYIGPARVDPNFDFDVALDLDATGKILVYPIRAIAGPLVGSVPTRVGIQTVAGSFEAFREAPERGYDTLSVKTITPGTVVAVELVDQLSGLCFYSLNGSSTYAKFVVDSVKLPTRQLYVRSVADANCGYRSLVADSIPTF
jgi:hypothetical protein